MSSPPAPQVVLTLRDPSITESSGLAVSARHPGIVWTHDDGGSSAQVLAVDRRGDTIARVTLAGIDPFDPEALAPSFPAAAGSAGSAGRDGDELYLGDLGDNRLERSDVSVFRFDEPAVLSDAVVPARWYRFSYPDGPHDAEALLVGPDGRILVATKGFGDAALYRAPRDLVTEDRGVNLLRRVARVPALVTDGAYLPDGRFVLRTYTSVYLYDGPGRLVGRTSLPLQPQGESIAVDGARLLIGSEGSRSQVLAVPVPAAPAAPGAQSRGPGPAVTSSGSPSGSRQLGGALAAGAAVAAGALLLLVRAARQRRRP